MPAKPVPQPTKKVEWRARAIKDDWGFSLVNDRVYWTTPVGHDGKDVEALRAWLNNSALLQGRHWSKHQYADSREQFVLDDGLFHYDCTPNGSYGYVYMNAWIWSELPKPVKPVTPYEAGCDARKAGVVVGDNPHNEADAAYWEWLRGWTDQAVADAKPTLMAFV